MPALAIDTATETCALALGDTDICMDRAAPHAGRSHLEILLMETENLLARNALGRKDITGIVVGTGPGTFSGLRIGIATARALAQSMRVPLAGHSSLEALALGMAAGGGGFSGDFLPVIDARRGQVFAQLFRRRTDGGLQALSEILCLEPDRLLEHLPALSTKPVMAAGNGVLAHSPLFEAGSGVESLKTDDGRHRISAEFHLPAAPSGLYDQKTLFGVVPVYVRDPDADKTVLLRKKEPWLR